MVNSRLSSGRPSAQLSCNKSVSIARLTCHSVVRAWDVVGWWADTVTCTNSRGLQLNAGMSEQLLLLLQSPLLLGQWCHAHCSNMFSRSSQLLNISVELLMMVNDYVGVDSQLPTCECLDTGNSHVTTWPAEQTAGHWLIHTTLIKSPPSPLAII